MSESKDYVEYGIASACDAIKSASQGMPNIACDELKRALRWMRRAAEVENAERYDAASTTVATE